MLKDTPPIESPTITLPRQAYNEMMERLAKYGDLLNEFNKLLAESNEIQSTTVKKVLPSGAYLEFRSNGVRMHDVMEGVFTALKYDRYSHIVNDLIKIGNGQK